MTKDKANETTIELNEWGIPDWRNEKAYGDVEAWSTDRWRWEFFRRRDDLRKCFDERAEREYQSNQLLLNDPTICVDVFAGKPSDPGFTVGFDESRELFGYISVPNPRIGAQPDGVIKPIDSYWSYRNVIDGARRTGEEIPGRQVKDQLNSAGIALTADQERSLKFSLLKAFPVMLEPHEVAVKFDLNNPIEPQLKKAKDLLRSYQIRRVGKLIQKRKHTEKWLSYLRSLDAKEANASSSEIADIHTHTAQTAQTVRDILEQAEALCFNF